MIAKRQSQLASSPMAQKKDVNIISFTKDNYQIDPKYNESSKTSQVLNQYNDISNSFKLKTYNQTY